MKNLRFNSLVERHYPALYAIAARVTSDPVAAISLTQRAFRRARRHLSENAAISRSRGALVQILLLEIASA